ncbi:MAG: hypothetical protein H0X08_03135 [Blastocatellia bacterium]|nr:hypothetical protein [Blastocatellia bacterium]
MRQEVTEASKPVESSEVLAGGDVNIRVGGARFDITDDNGSTRGGVKKAMLDSALQVILWLLQILFISFSSIIVALLYIKTRLAGGETISGLMSRFEDEEQSSRKWQERVRQRLIQSGRITSRSH